MVALKHFILAGCASLALLTGCNSGDGKSASRNAPGAHGPSSDQRASIADLKRSLDDVDDRIKILHERATRAGVKVQKDVQEDILKLEAARDRLYTQLQGLQTAGADGWEDLKSRTAASVDSLGLVVNKTWKAVTSTERSP